MYIPIYFSNFLLKIIVDIGKYDFVADGLYYRPCIIIILMLGIMHFKKVGRWLFFFCKTFSAFVHFSMGALHHPTHLLRPFFAKWYAAMPPKGFEYYTTLKNIMGGGGGGTSNLQSPWFNCQWRQLMFALHFSSLKIWLITVIMIDLNLGFFR